MTSFIQVPNIPEHKVKLGIIAGTDKNVVESVRSFGIEVLLTDTNNKIDKFISNHADVNLHHLGDKTIIADTSQTDLMQHLISRGMNVFPCEAPVSGKYPYDCRLNFTRMGNIIIGKENICEPRLKKYCERNKIHFVNVNQGYCKCSICIVNEKAVITDDESIKTAMDKNRIDCLLIHKGDILLNGYDYGFIGGAGVLINKNELLFFGNLKDHRDYHEIMQFLKFHKCTAVFSEDFPLTDIGGMIPVTEEE